MNSCLCVCALYVCACCVYIQAHRVQNENGVVLQEWPTRRDKRALFSFLNRASQVGKKATTKLLQGAEETVSETNPKTYKKHGSYKDAVQDFFSVEPKAVSRFSSNVGYEGMSGVVGDRVIVVKSHRGGFGKPTLEIWNYKSEKSIENIDIISYID